METWLPSHERHAMSLADATRAFCSNLLGDKVEEVCLWECSVIRAERFDWKRLSRPLPGMHVLPLQNARKVRARAGSPQSARAAGWT